MRRLPQADGRLTASWVMKALPALDAPTMTVPVLTPVRTAIGTPQSRCSHSFREATWSRISAAARTARSASSSWSSGSPKTPTMVSPRNCSTVAPCRSRTCRIRWK